MLSTNLRYNTVSLFFLFFLIIIFNTHNLFAANVTLSWTPPTTNADATPLTDLAGYKVYFGTSSGSYSQSADAGNVTSYTWGNLAAGTPYYFTITAYDTSGNESSFSNEVSKTLASVTYYCDKDTDSYINVIADGTCAGTGCEPSGCQTVAGNDCNDNNANINSAASDINCNGLDDNCNGQVDEECTASIKVSKVLLSEDFSSGIPQTWSRQGVWDSDNTCGKTIDYPFVAPYALADSSCLATGNEELVTSSFNTTSCNSVELAFSNQHYLDSGYVQINITGDGGANWLNTVNMPMSDGYPSPNWKNIDITAVTGVKNAKVKFSYVNNTSDGLWALDNIWVTCQTTQLDFSSQILKSSPTQTILLSNTGTQDLSIDNITIEGTDAPEFTIDDKNNCLGRTLLPAETCALDLVFLPVLSGSKNANLAITTNDPDTPVLDIPLTGIINPSPKVSINGKDSLVTLRKGIKAKMALELDPGNFEYTNADWWLLLERNNNWYYYDPLTKYWKKIPAYYDQREIINTATVEVMKTSNLPRGLYKLYFGVDTNANGSIDPDEYHYDEMSVRIKR